MDIHEDYLYRLIASKQWLKCVDYINKYAETINSDLLLRQASKIFEEEFFNAISNNLIYDEGKKELLDSLYILHSVKKLELSESNYKELILELVKISSLEESYNFALKYPEERVCNNCIEKYIKRKKTEDILKENNVFGNLHKWTEVYNALFNLIKDDNATTYFSLDRFIMVVRSFDMNFPTYYQYKKIREKSNLGFGRRDCFYDILMDLSDFTRFNVISKILEVIKPYERTKVTDIENYLGISDSKINVKKQKQKKYTVFISYSWDNDEHRNWVLNMANELVYAGVDVIFDQFDLKPGKSLNHFIENNISKADRVIVIYTPNYKAKATKRKGGVGFEYSILNSELYENQIGNKRIIPILRNGSAKTSIPTFMKQYLHINMTENNYFEDRFEELLREIYHTPKIKKPPLGKQPVFK